MHEKHKARDTEMQIAHILLNGFIRLYLTECAIAVFQKYRQYMSGLLTPPYGVMETGSNNDSKYEKLGIRWWASKREKERKRKMEILWVWVLNF